MSPNDSPSSNRNDFVIREGFPALRLPRKKKEDKQVKDVSDASSTIVVTPTAPWIDGDEPLPRFDFWGKEDCFEFGDDSIEGLWEDCRTVFSARTRDDDAAYSAGVTYFLPSQMKPRCALEAIVKTIFEAHTSCLEEGVMIPEQSGAEWWTLVLDEDQKRPSAANVEKNGANNHAEEEEEDEGDEVGMHFDADYGLEDQAPNLLLHPRVATVTYLTSNGAPTVVLQRRSPPPNDREKKSLEGPVSEAWVSHPKLGKHIAFDGRLLHGAPATFFPAFVGSSSSDHDDDENKEPPAKRVKSACSQRITLLVNVWVNHCPLDAEPLEDEVCDKLTPVLPSGKTDKDGPLAKHSFRWTEPELGTLPHTSEITLKPSEEDPAGEEEVVICGRLVSVKYNPTMEELHKASRTGGLVHISFTKNALMLEVGAEVQEEEENDDQDQEEEGNEEE